MQLKWSITPAVGGGATAVLHVPHASTRIPPDVRATICLTDEELEVELGRMTDSFTDELFALDPALASVIMFPVSRLVVDPERFLDDACEPMAARGMGVFYTHTSQRGVLRRLVAKAERARLVEQWYRPHHDRLTRTVEAGLAVRGQCLVIDCHSFASAALPYELDQSNDRPEVCLGTDAFHSPAALVQTARDAFANAGFTVALDRPFSGALVPELHYRRDIRVQALMVEINRGLYMNEQARVRSTAFDDVRERLHTALQEIIAAAATL